MVFYLIAFTNITVKQKWKCCTFDISSVAAHAVYGHVTQHLKNKLVSKSLQNLVISIKYRNGTIFIHAVTDVVQFLSGHQILQRP